MNLKPSISGKMTGAIAIIVVNWNGWKHTINCFNSLNSIKRPWHLFIVDNASTDDSVRRLSALKGPVTLICSQNNGGWTGGNNLGIKHALDSGFDQLFILNNDAEVQENTLDVLDGFFQENQASMPIVGPVHIEPSDGSYNFLGATINQLTGMPEPIPFEGISSSDVPPAIETSYIKGAGIFVHREHFEEIGFLDDDFYLNYDESDWCFRAKKAGFHSYILRDSIIRHSGSASIGGGASPLNIYFMTRNGLLFCKRHCSLKQRINYYRFLYRRARHLVNGAGYICWAPSFFTSRSERVVAFRQGVYDYLFKRFGDCPPEIRRL